MRRSRSDATLGGLSDGSTPAAAHRVPGSAGSIHRQDSRVRAYRGGARARPYGVGSSFENGHDGTINSYAVRRRCSNTHAACASFQIRAGRRDTGILLPRQLAKVSRVSLPVACVVEALFSAGVMCLWRFASKMYAHCQDPCAQKIHAVCCTRLNILNLCPIPTSLYATLVCDSREHQARAFQERVGPQCKQSFNPSRTQGHVAEPLVCGFFCACVSILSLVLFILVLPNVGDGIAICFETLHFLKGQFAELFRCFPSRKKLSLLVLLVTWWPTMEVVTVEEADIESTMKSASSSLSFLATHACIPSGLSHFGWTRPRTSPIGSPLESNVRA